MNIKINQMNIIRRLFHKHKWEYNVEGNINESGSIIRTCIKCGDSQKGSEIQTVVNRWK